MVSKGHALAREALVRTLTAYSGITTADGAFDGTTMIDSTLIGRNDFISEKTILIMSGDAANEDKGSLSFNSVTGEITLQGTGFSAQIKAGIIYKVLNISTVEIDVANIDAKIGTNTDAAGTTTLFAWMARLFAIGGQGLVYYGRVTQVDDVTHFRVAGLTGFGDAYLKNYRAYVVRDAAGLGAAPQGEMQPCSVYDSTDGIFTHTAFSVGLAVDDEVLLLHERVAEIKDLIEDVSALALEATLGTHDTDIKALLATIAGYIDTEVAAIKTQTDKIAGKMLFSMDFWSDPQEEIVMTGAQTTPGLPTVTIADLPATATIVRAIAMLKFRVVENTNAAENSLDKTVAQPIQVQSDAPGAWRDAINMVDEQFKIAGETREGGDVLIGSINIAVEVDENDGYEFQWLNAKAHLGNIQFNDVQTGLRIWYSV